MTDRKDILREQIAKLSKEGYDDHEYDFQHLTRGERRKKARLKKKLNGHSRAKGI
ncbi:MAG: hypothetical protein LBT50_06535 [Prevotellaceae bacterium]|nr:hypothetical protein [Prevotellaceae bacterium]